MPIVFQRAHLSVTDVFTKSTHAGCVPYPAGPRRWGEARLRDHAGGVRQNGAKVILGAGTLYGTLNRMLEGGLIEESGERIYAGLSYERRRYYRVTAAGWRAAVTEAERLQGLLRIARTKHLLRCPGPLEREL